MEVAGDLKVFRVTVKETIVHTIVVRATNETVAKDWGVNHRRELGDMDDNRSGYVVMAETPSDGDAIDKVFTADCDECNCVLDERGKCPNCSEGARYANDMIWGESD